MPFTVPFTRYNNTQYLNIKYDEQSFEAFRCLGFESKEPKNKVSMFELDLDIILIISNFGNRKLDCCGDIPLVLTMQRPV